MRNWIVGLALGSSCWSCSHQVPPPATTPARCANDMVRVPKSTFTMGNPSTDPYALESPAHEVTVDAYCIDKTEVTVAAYETCVAAKGCVPAPTTVDHLPGNPVYPDDGLCNGGKTALGRHPINCVTWFQADVFCAWAGKRLPTEAEWEHAARGDDGRVFPWGNEPPDRDAPEQRLAWASHAFVKGTSVTAPVGSFPSGASPFGALDMAGNVEEWNGDWLTYYGDAPETNPTGGTMSFGPWAERFRARFGEMPTPDPKGVTPAIQVGRGTRGGSMGFTDPKVYVTYERGTGLNPNWRDYALGFRCAKRLGR